MKAINLSVFTESIPVCHMQTKIKGGYELRFTTEENPEPGDILVTWERRYIVQEITETRPSTQDYGGGVKGNFYKAKCVVEPKADKK